MQVATYEKDKKKKIESKYHLVTKKIEYTCGLIHKNVAIKFHRERTQTKFLRININKLMKKSKIFIEAIVIPGQKISLFWQISSKKLDNYCQDNIDWTRGRFSGDVKKIFVRQGQIIEKVFITSKGNIISVKRSELGLLLRW